MVDVVPDDALGVLQPRVAAKASARSRGCASSGTGSRITPCGPHVDLDDRFEPVVAWHNPDPEYMQADDPGRGERDGARRSSTRSTTARTRTSTGGTAARTSELARGEFEWLQLLTHPEIWAFDGATMRESMESMLDADRAARLEHLRHDRIDLS